MIGLLTLWDTEAAPKPIQTGPGAAGGLQDDSPGPRHWRALCEDPDPPPLVIVAIEEKRKTPG